MTTMVEIKNVSVTYMSDGIRMSGKKLLIRTQYFSDNEWKDADYENEIVHPGNKTTQAVYNIKRYIIEEVADDSNVIKFPVSNLKDIPITNDMGGYANKKVA